MKNVTIKKIALAGLVLNIGLASMTAWANPRFYDEKNTTINITPSRPNFTIKLAENSGSTGYQWIFKSSQDDIFTLQSEHFTPPKSKALGAAGSETWVFHANKEIFAQGASSYQMTFTPVRGSTSEQTDPVVFTINVNKN